MKEGYHTKEGRKRDGIRGGEEKEDRERKVIKGNIWRMNEGRDIVAMC